MTEGAERFLEQALREVLRIARTSRWRVGPPQDRRQLLKAELDDWKVKQIRAISEDALAELEQGRFNEPLPPLHPEHVTGAVKGRHIA